MNETTYLAHRINEALGNPSGSHPTIGELLGVLGYETVYDALVAVVKEKGLWKWKEWGNGDILKK